MSWENAHEGEGEECPYPTSQPPVQPSYYSASGCMLHQLAVNMPTSPNYLQSLLITGGRETAISSN